MSKKCSQETLLPALHRFTGSYVRVRHLGQECGSGPVGTAEARTGQALTSDDGGPHTPDFGKLKNYALPAHLNQASA